MKIHFIPLLILFFLLFGCKKRKNVVPNIPFDITINLNLPSYQVLNGVSGWAYVNGGSRGIIVYRRNIDEFVAFDRHSPKDPEGNCHTPLFPTQENFLQLKDTCSGALFSLYDGSPISGAEGGLRQYQTVFNGSDQLRIFN